MFCHVKRITLDFQNRFLSQRSSENCALLNRPEPKPKTSTENVPNHLKQTLTPKPISHVDDKVRRHLHGVCCSNVLFCKDDIRPSALFVFCVYSSDSTLGGLLISFTGDPE